MSGEVGIATPAGLRFRVRADDALVTVRRVGALRGGQRRIVRTWDFGWLGDAAPERALLAARWAVAVLRAGADIERERLPLVLLRDGASDDAGA